MYCWCSSGAAAYVLQWQQLICAKTGDDLSFDDCWFSQFCQAVYVRVPLEAASVCLCGNCRNRAADTKLYRDDVGEHL